MRTRMMLLCCLIALGVAYRVWLLCQPIDLRGDGATRYDPIAVNLVEGNGFSWNKSPPYHADTFDVPGYPFLLAGYYSLGTRSLRLLFCVHVVFEAAGILLVYLTALRLTGCGKIAMLSGALAVASPFISSVGHNAMSEPVAFMLTSLLLFLLSKALHEPSVNILRWIAAGLTGGVALLVRADAYPVVALLPIAAAYSAYSRRPALVVSALGAFGCMAVLPLLPWVIRDYRITGQIRLPGHEQIFGAHAKNDYRRWLSTWMFDNWYTHDWTWHASGAPDPRNLPPYAYATEGDLDRIAEAFELIPQGQSIDFLREQVMLGNPIGKQDESFSIFRDLANERARTQPLRTYVAMPVLRVLFTWLRMPGTCVGPNQFVILFKTSVYVLWGVILASAALGLVGRKVLIPGAALVLMALFVSRSLIPFLTAGGIESRYLFPALPVVWILSAIGLYNAFGLFARSATRTQQSHGPSGEVECF